ncbi:MAG: PIN domain-containing protein [Euryarchaeota archaeon]|nr:PIN domain-containing protein [Euryarchaeota archaeon]
MRAVLDTSFLLMHLQERVDVFTELKLMLGEVELVVPEQVLEELERLAERGGRMGRFARSALEVARRRCRVVRVRAGSADEAVERLAGRGTIICTNDKVLKERVRKRGSPVVFMRARSKLVLEGYV